jgi:hypothetical protein
LHLTEKKKRKKKGAAADVKKWKGGGVKGDSRKDGIGRRVSRTKKIRVLDLLLYLFKVLFLMF